MIIRPAAPRDLPALSALYRGCLEEADWFPPSALAEIDFAKDTADELVFLAEGRAGELMGFIGVWQPESFVHHLYVATAHRGQGVGRALLAAIAGKIPYPWRLKCVVKNDAAYSFYASLGWREVQRSIGPRGEFALMQFAGP